MYKEKYLKYKKLYLQSIGGSGMIATTDPIAPTAYTRKRDTEYESFDTEPMFAIYRNKRFDHVCTLLDINEETIVVKAEGIIPLRHMLFSNDGSYQRSFGVFTISGEAILCVKCFEYLDEQRNKKQYYIETFSLSEDTFLEQRGEYPVTIFPGVILDELVSVSYNYKQTHVKFYEVRWIGEDTHEQEIVVRDRGVRHLGDNLMFFAADEDGQSTYKLLNLITKTTRTLVAPNIVHGVSQNFCSNDRNVVATCNGSLCVWNLMSDDELIQPELIDIGLQHVGVLKMVSFIDELNQQCFVILRRDLGLVFYNYDARDIRDFPANPAEDKGTIHNMYLKERDGNIYLLLIHQSGNPPFTAFINYSVHFLSTKPLRRNAAKLGGRRFMNPLK